MFNVSGVTTAARTFENGLFGLLYEDEFKSKILALKYRPRIFQET